MGRLQRIAGKSNASDWSAAMQTVVKWDAITHRTLICHPCSARSVVGAGARIVHREIGLFIRAGRIAHPSLRGTRAASTRSILPLGSFGRRPVSSYRACGPASRVGRIARCRVCTLLSWSPRGASCSRLRAQYGKDADPQALSRRCRGWLRSLQLYSWAISGEVEGRLRFAFHAVYKAL